MQWRIKTDAFNADDLFRAMFVEKLVSLLVNETGGVHGIAPSAMFQSEKGRACWRIIFYVATQVHGFFTNGLEQAQYQRAAQQDQQALSSITDTINSGLLILGVTFPSSIHVPSLCKEKAPEGAFSHVR